MKSLSNISVWLLEDIQQLVGTSTKRDIEYVTSRVKHEGLGALALTLGSFAEDFERSLEDGHVAPGSFAAFKKQRKAPLIPTFLSGIMSRVFDSDGRLLAQPDALSILCIRQVCRLAKKVEVPPKPAKVKACFRKFQENEQSMALHPFQRHSCWDSSTVEMFRKVSALLWHRLDDFKPGYPKHGPGAVAEKLLPNQKYNIDYWYTRLNALFPPDQYLVCRPDLILEHNYQELSPAQEKPVRVITVPKTQKGPRIIAIEPVAMQYVQQSICRDLMAYLEFKHPLTRGHLNFTDQTINARMALESSRSGKYATLDLSDASDLVHVGLVTTMLESCPNFRAMIMAARSTSADVPGHGLLRLRKYASMGSALCFPIEAMVFYTLLLSGILIQRGCSPQAVSGRRLADIRNDVFVYGDDLIVPVEEVHACIDTLTLAGLRVNSAKSFLNGKFRESCGVDAYDGVDVTPVYARRLPPSSVRDVSALVSYVSMANQLYSHGFVGTAHNISLALQCLGFKIPQAPVERDGTFSLRTSYVAYTFPALGSAAQLRWNAKLQRQEVLGKVVVPRKVEDPLEGYSALLRFYVTKPVAGLGSVLDQTPVAGSFMDLERSVSSGSLAIKTRWCPVH